MVLAWAVAEGKLLYYSHNRRDITHTVQGLLLSERSQLAGRRVFMQEWTRADRFVLEHIVGGEARKATDVDGFVRHGRPGDYYISGADTEHPQLQHVRATRSYRLCLRE